MWKQDWAARSPFNFDAQYRLEVGPLLHLHPPPHLSDLDLENSFQEKSRKSSLN